MKTKTNIILTCLLGSAFFTFVNAQSQTDPAGAAHQRVAAKIERVQEGAHKWEASGRDTYPIAKTMEEKVKPLLEAGKFAEAEEELDRVLEQLKQDGKSTASPTDPAQAAHQRIPAKIAGLMTAKLDHVKDAAQKWADSGSDPSDILRTMEEKFKPLMDAGKVVEAEAELNRALEQFKQDGKSTESPTATTEAVQQRKENAPKSMAEKFKPLMDAGKFIEAEAELDRLLEQLNKNAK